MLQGPNLELLRDGLRRHRPPGRRLRRHHRAGRPRGPAGLVADGVEGAIIGTALYEGRFTLEDALALTRPASRVVSLAVRVIPCLDVDAGRVVKGVNFQGPARRR